MDFKTAVFLLVITCISIFFVPRLIKLHGEVNKQETSIIEVIVDKTCPFFYCDNYMGVTYYIDVSSDGVYGLGKVVFLKDSDKAKIILSLCSFDHLISEHDDIDIYENRITLDINTIGKDIKSHEVFFDQTFIREIEVIIQKSVSVIEKEFCYNGYKQGMEDGFDVSKEKTIN